MHALVLGVGPTATKAGVQARGRGWDVTLVRGTGRVDSNRLGRPGRLDVECLPSGVVIEHGTSATFVDVHSQSVWVDSGGHEESIAYDHLIVCVGAACEDGCVAPSLLPGLDQVELKQIRNISVITCPVAPVDR